MQSLVLELIYTLITDAKRRVPHDRVKRSNYRVIESTIKYIQENLTADLSLEAISRRAGFTPIHFHNVFKASTGKTLRAYVEEQRVKKAANLLVTTDDTLAEIAYDCGFSSQSYFSYAFKRKTHKTPREYAKGVFERYKE